MAKKYEVTLQKTNARCIIHDEDLKGAWSFYPEKICIFTVDDKTNTIKPLVEFRTSRTLPRDEITFTIELKHAPCTKHTIPNDAKKAPELFFVPGEAWDVLYIRDDVAIRRKITIKSLGITVTSAEETLREPVQKLNSLYQSFSEELSRAETIPEAQGIYKEMEGILADIKSLIEVWASGSIDMIRAFNPKTMNSWKHSAEARAMGVPNVGDHLYGIVKGISFRPCVIPVCITSVNGEQIEFAHAADVNNPHGFAYITYTVPTEQFKRCLFKSEDDAANYLAELS